MQQILIDRWLVGKKQETTRVMVGQNKSTSGFLTNLQVDLLHTALVQQKIHRECTTGKTKAVVLFMAGHKK